MWRCVAGDMNHSRVVESGGKTCCFTCMYVKDDVHALCDPLLGLAAALYCLIILLSVCSQLFAGLCAMTVHILY